MIRFRCPQCQKKMQVEDRHAGRTVQCPYCGLRMRSPGERAATHEGPIPEPEETFPEEALLEQAVADRAFPEPAIPDEAAPPVEPEAAEPERLIPASPPRAAAARHREDAADAPLVPAGQKIDFEDLIDMTAMVDIVFFLLIFFLVTSMHALDSSIPMPVPGAQQAEAGAGGAAPAVSDIDDSQIVVQIDKNDVISVDGVEVHNAQELLFRLRELRNGPGRPEKLLVLGNGGASHGAAVMVLDAGHEVELEVRLAVRDENEL